MAPFFVMLGVWAVVRGVGLWAGIGELNDWSGSARVAVAVTFLMTGVMHFTKMRNDFARMVPRWFVEPMAIVYFTGLCEILGAVGILVPGTRRVAGICLAILLVVLLPGNVRAAREGLRLGDRAPTPLTQRILMQVVLVVVVLWATR